MLQTNILQYLEKTAPRVPDKIAYSNGTDAITFLELSEQSRALGSALLGLGYKREAIAILMEKHPRVPIAFYGVVYAGCFYVPMDTDMPPQRMETVLNQVHARAVIVDAKGEKLAKSLHFSGKVLRFEDLITNPIHENALCSVRASQLDVDPIYVVFTSGSTGVPKGVVACHRSVIDYTEALSDALGFSEENVFANQTPLFFDAPLKELMPVIKFGATAYFVPKHLFMFPVKLCEYLNEHRINTVCWVVSALTMISGLGALEKTPPKYLKTVAFGSEVFPMKDYQLWRNALPDATFFNLYGPTEATGMSCYWKAERVLAEDEPIPIGHPFCNTGVLLIDESGREAANGEIGEIYLRGTCVTLGYYNNAEKTAEAFVQNPLQNVYPEILYKTGDLARRNEHNELVFVSRKDAQIKHMGHRVELGEIEANAAKCKDISRACCVYDAQNKRIVLYYTGTIDTGELVNFLKAYLPKYMLPSVCKRLECMPLTPNGKMDRKTLLQNASQI